MPPATPRATWYPPAPGEPFAVSRGIVARDRDLLNRRRPFLGLIRLRGHLADLGLDRPVLGERAVAVRDVTGQDLFLCDRDVLSRQAVEARPGSALQLLAALGGDADELELVADCIEANHPTPSRDA